MYLKFLKIEIKMIIDNKVVRDLKDQIYPKIMKML